MSTDDGAKVSEISNRSILQRLQSSWNQGLSDLLAPRQKSTHPWKVLLFHTERETLVYGSSKGTPLGRFNADDDAGHIEPLKAEVNRLARGPKDVCLRLAPELVFDHRLRIPAGTRDVAAAIVRNQVERISPWPEPETVHGFEIQGRDASSAGQIEVRVAVTSTSVIASAMAQARKLDLEPSAIDCGPTATDDGILLRSLQADASGKRARGVNVGLGVGLTLSLVAGTVGAYSAWQGSARLEAVRADLTSINQRLDEADRRTRDASQVQASRLALLRRKSHDPAVMTLVETLSRVLPDNVYLTDLTIHGQQARLFGRATDASSLIATLENTREFENVSFSAPTVREKGAGLESFSIVAVTKVRQSRSAAP